jgi:hypothetical protein
MLGTKHVPSLPHARPGKQSPTVDLVGGKRKRKREFRSTLFVPTYLCFRVFKTLVFNENTHVSLFIKDDPY